MERSPPDRGKQASRMGQASHQMNITTNILEHVPQTPSSITSKELQRQKKLAAGNLVDKLVYHTKSINVFMDTMNGVSGNCHQTHHQVNPFKGGPNPPASSGGLLIAVTLGHCRQPGSTATVLMLLVISMLLVASAEVTSGEQQSAPSLLDQVPRLPSGWLSPYVNTRVTKTVSRRVSSSSVSSSKRNNITNNIDGSNNRANDTIVTNENSERKNITTMTNPVSNANKNRSNSSDVHNFSLNGINIDNDTLNTNSILRSNNNNNKNNKIDRENITLPEIDENVSPEMLISKKPLLSSYAEYANRKGSNSDDNSLNSSGIISEYPVNLTENSEKPDVLPFLVISTTKKKQPELTGNTAIRYDSVSKSKYPDNVSDNLQRIDRFRGKKKYGRIKEDNVDEEVSGTAPGTSWYPLNFDDKPKGKTEIIVSGKVHTATALDQSVTESSHHDFDYSTFRYTPVYSVTQGSSLMSPTTRPENHKLKRENSYDEYLTTMNPLEDESTLASVRQISSTPNFWKKKDSERKIYISHRGHPRIVNKVEAKIVDKSLKTLKKLVSVTKRFTSRGRERPGHTSTNDGPTTSLKRAVDQKTTELHSNFENKPLKEISKMKHVIVPQPRSRYHTASIEKLERIRNFTEDTVKTDESFSDEDIPGAYSEENGYSLEDIHDIFNTFNDKGDHLNDGGEKVHAVREVTSLLEFANNFKHYESRNGDDTEKESEVEYFYDVDDNSDEHSAGTVEEDIHVSALNTNTTGDIDTEELQLGRSVPPGEGVEDQTPNPIKRNADGDFIYSSHGHDTFVTLSQEPYFEVTSATPLHAMHGPPYDHYRARPSLPRPTSHQSFRTGYSGFRPPTPRSSILPPPPSSAPKLEHKRRFRKPEAFHPKQNSGESIYGSNSEDQYREVGHRREEIAGYSWNWRREPTHSTTRGGGLHGNAGRDYPAYDRIPRTSFTCHHLRQGIYADPEAGCQVWHVCEVGGRQHSFLCPNGTLFNQKLLTCDWWHNVNCQISEAYYNSGLSNSVYKQPSSTRGGGGVHRLFKGSSHVIYRPRKGESTQSRDGFVSSRNKNDGRDLRFPVKYYSPNKKSFSEIHNYFDSEEYISSGFKHNEDDGYRTYSTTPSSSSFFSSTPYPYTPEITTYAPKFNIRLDGSPRSLSAVTSSSFLVTGLTSPRPDVYHYTTAAPPIVTTVSTTVTQVTPLPPLSVHSLSHAPSKAPPTPPLPPPPRNFKSVFSRPHRLSRPKVAEFEPFYGSSYPMFRIVGKKEIKPIYKRHSDLTSDKDNGKEKVE